MSEELYTYQRVMTNGEWRMVRTPVKGKLANGAPVFPKVSPGIKAGEQPGAYSSMMDRLLNPQSFNGTYRTDNTSQSETTVHIPMVIDSDSLRERGMLGTMLVARLSSYTEQGFKWIIEAEPGNGPGKISLLNQHLGQLFIVYFRHQTELARWAAGLDVKPYRIERRTVPYMDQVGIDETLPDVEDVVDFVITGGRPGKKSSSDFGRKVELEEG